MNEDENLLLADLRSLEEGLEGLIGVDEVGRGPLAGPVYAASVFVNECWLRSIRNCGWVQKVNDSKKLSESDRRVVVKSVRRALLDSEGGLGFAVGVASIQEIEAHNILNATALAMNRSLEELLGKLSEEEDIEIVRLQETLFGGMPKADCRRVEIVVDGRPMKKLNFSHRAVVKGDGKHFCVALASIIAKVARDELMNELHQKYPQHGWDSNKGYGTHKHRDAIHEFGPTEHHRASFLKNIINPSSSKA